ncbi:MAG TPA: sugar kinase [Caulobacteraceae bacterium]|jgi:2-dehydro-3-deoxygluconokinase
MTRVIAIGECMVELSAAGPGLLRRRFAGDAYNTAVYLKRVRPRIDVSFLTVTGDDPLSHEMRAAWAAEGVRDDLAFTDPARRPALYLIETDAAGDRRFHYWRGESAARQWFQKLKAQGPAALETADLVYVSGISFAILAPAERTEAQAFLAGLKGRTTIAFDPNLRPALWDRPQAAVATFEAFAGIADIVLPSRQDMDSFYGPASSHEHLDRIARLGGREVVLTCEGDDALVHDRGQNHALTPPRATVVDTSGGGDSFNGAYLAARLTGADPVQAAREGLALAAKVVEQPGALIDP